MSLVLTGLGFTQFRPNTALSARPNLHAATMVPTGGPFGSVTRAGKLSPCHWRVGPARQGRFFPVNLARVALSSLQWPISSPWNPRPLGPNPRGATLLTLAHLLGISPGPFHRQTSTECR
jgi:hypothetical protein